MFGKLVVPLDGSELAERALPYAVRLAAAAKGELVLVRVALAPPPPRLDGVDWERDQLDAVREAEAYLTNVADKLANEVNVMIAAPYGHAAGAILETVDQLGADGVVMATHGRTRVAHFLYGSVAESVLADCPVPVFLVHARPGEAPAPPLTSASPRVAVPLDGSTFSEAALRSAVDLVGPTGHLVLITVVEPPDHVERDENGRVIAYLDQQEEARTRDAREYLFRVAAGLRLEFPSVRVNVDVRLGDPADGIIMSALDHGAEVVVMSTHGRTGLRRALMGSVAGAVLRMGCTPVLLVGPHESHRMAPVLAAQGQRH